MLYNLEDTICAQATPQGKGGIHVIRVSGSKSLSVVKKIFKSKNKKDSFSFKSHRVYYGFIFDPDKNKNIDSVLLSYFRTGSSFTGEETIEISTHGNPLIVKNILDLLCKYGCRLSERGEFSYRAYKNARLTLNQAEAVLSLIEATNESSLSRSLGLLDGNLRADFKLIEEQLIWIISRLEARIDFSTEDIEIVSNTDLMTRLIYIQNLLSQSVASFKRQQIVDKGIKVVIVGQPNVGKSSLFNAIIGQNRSLISDTAGTTRDYVSELATVHGLKFEFIDTAGLRSSLDPLEGQGIQRSLDLIPKADLVLVVASVDNPSLDFLQSSQEILTLKRKILVLNKLDLNPDFKTPNFDFQFDSTVKVSALNVVGIDELFNEIKKLYLVTQERPPLEIVSLRHSQLMENLLTEVDSAMNCIESSFGDEFVLSHLMRGLKYLFEIFEIKNDEVVRDQIFKDFCLGK